MTKFNITGSRAATGSGPITADPDTRHINAEGGIGYRRDDKSDLYLLATTSLDLTADAYYERGDARVLRFADLIGKTAVADPDWTYRFLTWLRTKGNIRTAAVVGGVEAARAMAVSGIPGGRHMMATVLRRADEPGEALAYHHALYGRSLPMAVKRGIGDGAARLYTERSVLKYDTGSHGLRFADVLAITHPAPLPERPWQHDLFGHIIDRRYGRTDQVPASLRMIGANSALRVMMSDPDGFDWGIPSAGVIDAAGMTWEDILSALGSKVDKADLWRNLIPSMGFMARLRNLRNFDQAGLSDADVRPVLDMLMDADQVRASRQLPLRFLSAYRAAGHNLRWAYPLEVALGHSIDNIPVLTGRTLIMVDTSASMNSPLSGRTDLMRWDAAAAFGLALSKRCDNVDVVSYSGGTYSRLGYAAEIVTRQFPTIQEESLLKAVDRWKTGGYFINGGTNTAASLRHHYQNHDRVVLLTDEQAGDYNYNRAEVSDAIPATRPLYTLNLAGYRSSHAATGRNRLIIGGLTDHMFGLITQVEKGYPGGWPWTGDPDIPALPTYPARVGVTTRSAE